jgi:hypothetical protein
MTSEMQWALGIVATVFIGIIGIYITIYLARRNRIAFIKEICIGLFDSFVQTFPELEVLYEKQPVSQNPVLLKGAFVNTGSNDITPDMVERELRIVLPEGCHWRRSKIIYSPSNVTHVQNNKTERVFTLGLFRRDECIRFEALAEIPTQTGTNRKPAEVLEESLRFDHRIANTMEVKTQKLQFLRNNILNFILLELAVVVAVSGIMLAVQFFLLRNDARLVLSWMIDASKSIDVAITPKLDGTVDLKGINESFTTTIPLEKLFQGPSELRPRIINVANEHRRRRIWTFVILGVLWSVLVLFLFVRWRTIGWINRLFAQSQNALLR